MGDRALLVIDGQPRLLSPGQAVQGVRLLRWVGERAEIDDGGTPRTLPLGTPVQVGDGAPPAPAREVVIPAGSGGHFSTLGSINGHAVTFLVDTGATMVSMGAEEARRLGLDLSRARAGLTQTANGRVPVQIVVLDRVRVGDLELANVDAAILPLQMPQVLLGNSFLSRLQMQRSNDTLRLQLR
ncbi:MAG: retroviral-like aspartic protease family protein [Burkholderiales bacterium]|nr:retroviral-like aspartic protease family protein [Burkholderiales bacterium]